MTSPLIIRSLTFDEVVVPARPGAIDSAEMRKPLHMLPVGGRSAHGINTTTRSRDWAACNAVVVLPLPNDPSRIDQLSPFERSIIFATDPLPALDLAASLLASFALIAGVFPGREPSRKALAGPLFDFAFAGHVSNYPCPLIGHGVAPILGFALARDLTFLHRLHLPRLAVMAADSAPVRAFRPPPDTRVRRRFFLSVDRVTPGPCRAGNCPES